MTIREAQESVRNFMIKAGQECPAYPVIPRDAVLSLREQLHYEEAVVEFGEANFKKNLQLVADSLADSLVVILGSAVAFGIDIEPIFQEVMRSNMTKFIDGHKREDGKWIKGPSYEPANIQPLLEKQLCDNSKTTI